MANPLIFELLQQPHAHLIIQKIQDVLDTEKVRRIALYNDITEQQKLSLSMVKLSSIRP